MDGFDKLKETLLASAQSEAEAILASATAQAAAIGQRSADEIAALRAQADKESREQDEAEARRVSAMSTLDARRAQLGARQHLLDEVLDETLDALRRLPPEKKSRYYRGLLEQYAQPGMVVVCAPADETMVRGLLADLALSNALESDAGQQGGLLFRSGRVLEDFRFDSTLRARRDEYLSAAAAILFGEQKKMQGGNA